MDTLKSFLNPFASGTNAIQDTLKLVVLGGTVETARRASVSAWNGFVDSFFLTAHFAQGDFPYDWIMHWLAQQPAWAKSREFEITTRSLTRGGVTSRTAGDIEDEDEEDDLVGNSKKKRRVSFMPSLDTTHTIYYHGHWLRITRSRRYPDDTHGASIRISVVARNNDILKKLVLEAKRDYEKDSVHRVNIYLADTQYNCWRWNGSRHKRPMSSIVLQPGVKDMILNDCKDFLASEAWYADRGIPFRRGYLLHGVPGSGKTSLIHSLAGELSLDIYVLSLSAKGMSDNTLTTLMGLVPSRCIVLLEDLDAAFTRSVSRDSNSTGAPTAPTEKESNENKDKKDDGSTLSLSGLLNSLDGVAAAEGRLLFATTNHIERLDPALSRPGRMDVWVNFAYATKYQAEGIFKCFFPVESSTPEPEETSEISESQELKDLTQQNLPLPKKKINNCLISFSEVEITELAKRFGEAIPENELSVASLQGYLLKNKTRPRECVDEVDAWIIQERETREKLKKEKAKAELEAKEKEKKAAEEKKEKEAKEKEAKDAKEAKEKKEKKKVKKSSRSDSSAKTDEVAASSKSTSESSTSAKSSSESDNSTGADGDTEESITSEDEADKKGDKWISVKGQATNAAAAPAASESASSAEVSK